MSYLGLDVGTSGCKAVVFDDRGNQKALAYRPYSVLQPQEGWAELDPSQVLQSCMEVIREAASACADDPVRGMGISSMGESITPLGVDGEILGNALVSSDARAESVTRSWSQDFGCERLYRKTGHTPFPMYSLYKLLWLRDNQPDIWERAGSFYCFEDLIHRRLGLDPAMSWPLAGRTMLFNVLEHRWDREILSAVGLDNSKLPRTLPSGAVVGTIPPSVADELGLPDEVIVVTGGHDQTCGALGAGIASSDRAVYGIGTVECITPAFSSPIFSDELFQSNLATYDYTVQGMYTTVAFSITGGNLLQWYRDELGHKEAQQALETGASAYEMILNSIPNEPTSLLVLPYFTPSGTPYFDMQVKGAILGLRLSTRREEILRALLEGVTFEMRLNLDILGRSGISINELVAIGGGAKNLKWLQLKSDVLNRPISRAAVTEAGCLGVAMLACAAHTGAEVSDLAKDWVRITEVIEPQAEHASRYLEMFDEYIKLYPTLRSLS